MATTHRIGHEASQCCIFLAQELGLQSSHDSTRTSRWPLQDVALGSLTEDEGKADMRRKVV